MRTISRAWRTLRSWPPPAPAGRWGQRRVMPPTTSRLERDSDRARGGSTGSPGAREGVTSVPLGLVQRLADVASLDIGRDFIAGLQALRENGRRVGLR